MESSNLKPRIITVITLKSKSILKEHRQKVYQIKKTSEQYLTEISQNGYGADTEDNAR